MTNALTWTYKIISLLPVALVGIRYDHPVSGDHRALDTRAASEIFGSREAHTIGSEGVAIPTPAPCVGSVLTSDSSGCVAVVVVVVVVGDMVMGSVCMGGS